MATDTTHSEDSMTAYAVSADGTRVAYEVSGSGPALVLVDGALCQRSMGPARPLAKLLAAQFTVHAYDRRGRGESGAGETPYHPDREVEDLAAVIAAAGGHAHVFGSSAGATHAPNAPDLPEQVQALVDAGHRGAAVALFMKTVGAPGPMVAVMRLLPVW